MKKKSLRHKIIQGIYHYLIFFLLVAFLTTCSTMLFASTLADTLNIELDGENLGKAAKLTFANVIVCSVLITVIDVIRRRCTTERTAKRVKEAAQRMAQGDFNVRISPVSRFQADDNFNEIIRCFNTIAAELSGVETLRTDFIANVSHEMKTPLAVLQNYGTLLQAPGLEEAKRIEYAKGVTDTSRRLADMMTNVLKLNRLENQQIYPKTAEYDLGEQLCECLLNYETIWEKKDITLETDIAENIIVNADAELLSLVWNNLFSNAFKFTPEGGTVSVSLAEEDGWICVRVRDTGCGMTPEIGAHIFEKFYQGDTSHATQGNGLGLTLVKRVADIMRGEISVESAPGRGSTFTVKLRKSL